MKSFALTIRPIAFLAVIFCLLLLGTQPLHAQQTVSFPNFSSTANLRVNGNAAVVTATLNDQNVRVLRLTPSADGQVGSAWYATSLSLKSGFTTTFTFRLSNPGGIGAADGIAFVIQNGSFQANGTSGSLAIGDPNFSGGGAIGFQDLTHSVAVEFDTFENAGPGPNNDISGNEVGIQSCGAAANTADHGFCNFGLVDPSSGGFDPPIILTDQNVHVAVITYTPSGLCELVVCPGHLTITLDGQQVLSSAFNLASLGLDPNQDAFVGFTAATGAGEEDQDILSWSFTSTQSQVTGAPISGDNLTQTITFNNNFEGLNGDQYILDYTNASATITANSNATPFITNQQITPADWSTFVRGTPFATTTCIPINGANGNCTAKKQVCTLSPGDTTPSGDKCPQSSDRNILLSARFDAPTITDPATVFGVVEGTDDWAGGVCGFVPGSPEGPFPCPQGGLVEFKGPGEYTGRRGGASTNSTYTWVVGVRPPSTAVTGFVNGAGWTKVASPSGTFTSNPATLLNPSNPSDPINNGMTVAPIDSITYGTNASSGGLPSTTLPVPNDVTIFNPNASSPGTPQSMGSSSFCPNTITPTTVANPFPQTVQVGPFADGSSNVLHYFTRDCAGTEELSFTSDKTNPAIPVWSTNFKAITINVDLTKPDISSGPALSPAPANNNGVPNSYLLNQAVTATYTCRDKLPSGGGLASGLATCNSTGVPGAPTSATFTKPVGTSASGSFNFTVAGPTDVAGNIGLPASAPYTVVDQPVNLDLFYLATPKVKPGTTLTYFIAALNLTQKNIAAGVTVTNMAPAGTTVVSAIFDKISCLGGICSIPKKGTACTIGAATPNGTPITCNIGSLAPLNTFTGTGILIVVKVPANAPLNSVLTDTATALSLNRDSDGRDNSITINTVVKNN
jgi:uncharacterized repeat protein (TIGR01451 family)